MPTALRDRLAARAHRTNTTLAGALARALDESEEQELWSAVRQAHADDALGRHGW